MNSALLENGKLITASEYNPDKNDNRLYCIDKACKVPVIFVPSTETINGHFKTTGKNDSKHKPDCGFFAPLDMVDTIKKVEEYQSDLLNNGVKEIVVRVNMKRIDPDYESKTTERETSDEKKNEDIKIKDENKTPASIGSVKSVVKLLNSYEPDLLAQVLINIGGGTKVPLSEMIISPKKAHQLLWSNHSLPVGYFVYGRVKRVVRREKVIYISLEEDNTPFTAVIFEKYFKHFTYTENELNGKDVLIYGMLRKNNYNDKEQTEIVIKSDKYIETIKRKKSAAIKE